MEIGAKRLSDVIVEIHSSNSESDQSASPEGRLSSSPDRDSTNDSDVSPRESKSDDDFDHNDWEVKMLAKQLVAKQKDVARILDRLVIVFFAGFAF